jgi:hypothetical protein
MVQRAEREPTMEEIVVALRDARRDADRTPQIGPGRQIRGYRGPKRMVGSTDLADLRDGEIERLLAENARLNASVVSLLKVIEQEQAYHAEAAAEAAAESAPGEPDREAIYHEVRSALEAELAPVLVVLLRLLQKQRSEPITGEHDDGPIARLAVAASEAVPSDWIVDLMHRLDDRAPSPNETVAGDEAMPRRPKLRQCMADVLNAFGIESASAAPRRRFTSRDKTP